MDNKMTAEQALEMLGYVREPMIIREIDGSRTIKTRPISETRKDQFDAIRQAMSAPRVPDGFRSEIEEVRDLIAGAPIDSLGTAHSEYCAPWPIRDEVVDRLTAMLAASPEPVAEIGDAMKQYLRDEVRWPEDGTPTKSELARRKEIADLRAEVEALREREDAMCDLQYARGLAAGQNFVERGDYDGLNKAISKRMTPAVSALEAARLREGGGE